MAPARGSRTRARRRVGRERLVGHAGACACGLGAGAATDGRDQRELVARLEHPVLGRVLAVYGHHQRQSLGDLTRAPIASATHAPSGSSSVTSRAPARSRSTANRRMVTSTKPILGLFHTPPVNRMGRLPARALGYRKLPHQLRYEEDPHGHHRQGQRPRESRPRARSPAASRPSARARTRRPRPTRRKRPPRPRARLSRSRPRRTTSRRRPEARARSTRALARRAASRPGQTERLARAPLSPWARASPRRSPRR